MSSSSFFPSAPSLRMFAVCSLVASSTTFGVGVKL
jgi:hypothetical protein